MSLSDNAYYISINKMPLSAICSQYIKYYIINPQYAYNTYPSASNCTYYTKNNSSCNIVSFFLFISSALIAQAYLLVSLWFLFPCLNLIHLAYFGLANTIQISRFLLLLLSKFILSRLLLLRYTNRSRHRIITLLLIIIIISSVLKISLQSEKRNLSQTRNSLELIISRISSSLKTY